MSDAKQPEQMRPIPDGGLKDAMPSWLKRPPAWRDLPTAEQRHERGLPEPDTSEIDPRSLVDVSDLPKWLQAIAARGDIPVPVPDPSVDHAVEVVQAAQKPAPVQSETQAEVAHVGPDIMPVPDDHPTETTVPEPVATPPSPASSASGGFIIPVWILPVAALVIIALLITIVVLL
jgi:hypothetical protein